MSYLKNLEKMSVSVFCKQASRRIDGIAMYFVCSIFALFAVYSALADWLGWPLPMPYWKGFWGALFLVPITFIVYVSFVYYSAPGKLWHGINAILLVAIPFYVAFKFNLFL